jgi:arylsulfatase A-like enzyme
MKPNIVFIFPDQLRADFLGCYGAGFAKTPHIDRLASESVQYMNAVSPSPVCVPARASLLVGRNCIRTGVFHNDQWLRPDHSDCGMPSWPELLVKHGYYTASIGKMHFYPWDISEGFLHRVIAEDKRHYAIRDDYHHYLKAHGFGKYHARENPGYHEHKGAACTLIPLEHQVDVWTADRTVDFIEGYDSDQPFACMVGFPSPHCPYDPPSELAALFNPDDMPASIPENETTEHFREGCLEPQKLDWNGVDYSEFTEARKKRLRAYYSALVHLVDLGVGRIRAALERKGVMDNTVIVLASDHGEYAGDYGLIGKSHFFRPSIHVPMLVRLPEKIHRREDEVVSLTDLFSTILSLAGVEHEETADSRVLPGLPRSAGGREHLFAASLHGYMLIRGRWKFSRYFNGVRVLNDREADPDDQVNRHDDPSCGEILRELNEIMEKEIDRAIQDANGEKIVDRGGLCGEGPFGERGWRRTYPFASPDFQPHHLVKK